MFPLRKQKTTASLSVMENDAQLRESYDARAALADAQDAADRAGRRVRSPRGYYLAHGLAAALLVLGGTVAPRPWDLIALVIAALSMGLLVWWYQRSTGVWVTIAQAHGTARRIWIGYGVLFVVLVIGAMALADAGHAWVGWPAAALALLASLAVGHFLEPRLPLANRLAEFGDGREGSEGTGAGTGAGR